MSPRRQPSCSIPAGLRRACHAGPTVLLLLAFGMMPSTAASQQTPADREGVVELDKARLGTALGQPLAGDALDTATDRVATVMRCPVCQGMSISASPSMMAVAMKEQVRELLSLGYTEKQVWDYFEGSYGEFVRLEPKREGLNWLVWLAPPLTILFGAFLIIAFQRSQRRQATASADTDALELLLERVREETRT